MDRNKNDYQSENRADDIYAMDKSERAILLKKINQGLAELERGEGQDWEEFKAEWRSEDEPTQ